MLHRLQRASRRGSRVEPTDSNRATYVCIILRGWVTRMPEMRRPSRALTVSLCPSKTTVSPS